MREIISIRADFSGVAEYYLLKLSKTRRNLLPGGFILLRVTGRYEQSACIEFAQPLRFTRRRAGWAANVSAGEEVSAGDVVLTLVSEVAGKVSIGKKNIKVGGDKVRTYDALPEIQLEVKTGDEVKAGQVLANMIAPADGVLIYRVDDAEKCVSKTNRINFIQGIEIFNGMAYSIPEDFKVFVRAGEEVPDGRVLAEGEDPGADYDPYRTSQAGRDEDEMMESEESGE